MENFYIIIIVSVIALLVSLVTGKIINKNKNKEIEEVLKNIEMRLGTLPQSQTDINKIIPYNVEEQKDNSINDDLKIQTNEDIDKIILGDSDVPEIMIYRPNKYRTKVESTISMNDGSKNGFTNLISQVANISGTLTFASQKVVEFSPEVAKGLKNGAFRLMETKGITKAIAVKSNGQIAEIGKIITKVNPIAVGLAVWQVMAMITAQKFLSDINKKLAQIEKGINDIKEFLENDRFGKIIGNLNYLKDVASILQGGNLNQSDVVTYNNQIEQIERECLQMMGAISMTIGTSLENYKGIDFDRTGVFDFSSLDKNQKAAIEIIKEHEKILRPYLITLYVRTIAAQLKCSLPVENSIANQRIVDIGEQLKKVKDYHESFDKYVVRNSLNLKGNWKDSQQKEKDKQNELIKFKEDVFSQINNPLVHINEVIIASKNNIREMEEIYNHPLKILVTSDSKGNIELLQRISDD